MVSSKMSTIFKTLLLRENYVKSGFIYVGDGAGAWHLINLEKLAFSIQNRHFCWCQLQIRNSGYVLNDCLKVLTHKSFLFKIRFYNPQGPQKYVSKKFFQKTVLEK